MNAHVPVTIEIFHDSYHAKPEITVTVTASKHDTVNLYVGSGLEKAREIARAAQKAIAMANSEGQAPEIIEHK